MEISEEARQTVEELQVLEQHLHSFLAQKQTVQVEVQEIENALNEVKNSKDDVYKMLSGIMIKAEKESLIGELDEKKKLLELRINSIEKQESILGGKVKGLREKISNASKIKDKK
jgi:prefoldin beta subunit